VAALKADGYDVNYNPTSHMVGIRHRNSHGRWRKAEEWTEYVRVYDGGTITATKEFDGSHNEAITHNTLFDAKGRAVSQDIKTVNGSAVSTEHRNTSYDTQGHALRIAKSVSEMSPDASGQTVTKTYDQTQLFSYGSDGKVSSEVFMTYNDGGSPWLSSETKNDNITYNAKGQRISWTTTSSSNATTDVNVVKATNAIYDGLGRLLKSDQSTSLNGILQHTDLNQTNSYDDLGRVNLTMSDRYWGTVDSPKTAVTPVNGAIPLAPTSGSWNAGAESGGGINGLSDAWSNGHAQVVTTSSYYGNGSLLSGTRTTAAGTGTNADGAVQALGIRSDYVQSNMAYNATGQVISYHQSITQAERYSYYKEVKKGLSKKIKATEVVGMDSVASDVSGIQYDNFGRQVHSVASSYDQNAKAHTQVETWTRSFDANGRALKVDRTTWSHVDIPAHRGSFMQRMGTFGVLALLTGNIGILFVGAALASGKGSLTGGKSIVSYNQTSQIMAYKADGTVDDARTHTDTLANWTKVKGMNWDDHVMQVTDITMKAAQVVGAVLSFIFPPVGLAITAVAAIYNTARAGISLHDLGVGGRDREGAKQRAMGFYTNVASVVMSWVGGQFAGAAKTATAAQVAQQAGGVSQTLTGLSAMSTGARVIAYAGINAGVQMGVATLSGADSRTTFQVGAMAAASGLVQGYLGASGLSGGDMSATAVHLAMTLSGVGEALVQFGGSQGTEASRNGNIMVGGFLKGAAGGANGFDVGGGLQSIGERLALNALDKGKNNPGSDNAALRSALIQNQASSLLGAIANLGMAQIKAMSDGFNSIGAQRSAQFKSEVVQERQFLAGLDGIRGQMGLKDLFLESFGLNVHSAIEPHLPTEGQRPTTPTDEGPQTLPEKTLEQIDRGILDLPLPLVPSFQMPGMGLRSQSEPTMEDMLWTALSDPRPGRVVALYAKAAGADATDATYVSGVDQVLRIGGAAAKNLFAAESTKQKASDLKFSAQVDSELRDATVGKDISQVKLKTFNLALQDSGTENAAIMSDPKIKQDPRYQDLTSLSYRYEFDAALHKEKSLLEVKTLISEGKWDEAKDAYKAGLVQGEADQVKIMRVSLSLTLRGIEIDTSRLSPQDAKSGLLFKAATEFTKLRETLDGKSVPTADRLNQVGDLFKALAARDPSRVAQSLVGLAGFDQDKSVGENIQAIFSRLGNPANAINPVKIITVLDDVFAKKYERDQTLQTNVAEASSQKVARAENILSQGIDALTHGTNVQQAGLKVEAATFAANTLLADHGQAQSEQTLRLLVQDVNPMAAHGVAMSDDIKSKTEALLSTLTGMVTGKVPLDNAVLSRSESSLTELQGKQDVLSANTTLLEKKVENNASLAAPIGRLWNWHGAKEMDTGANAVLNNVFTLGHLSGKRTDANLSSSLAEGYGAQTDLGWLTVKTVADVALLGYSALANAGYLGGRMILGAAEGSLSERWLYKASTSLYEMAGTPTQLAGTVMKMGSGGLFNVGLGDVQSVLSGNGLMSWKQHQNSFLDGALIVPAFEVLAAPVNVLARPSEKLGLTGFLTDRVGGTVGKYTLQGVNMAEDLAAMHVIKAGSQPVMQYGLGKVNDSLGGPLSHAAVQEVADLASSVLSFAQVFKAPGVNLTTRPQFEMNETGMDAFPAKVRSAAESYAASMEKVGGSYGLMMVGQSGPLEGGVTAKDVPAYQEAAYSRLAEKHGMTVGEVKVLAEVYPDHAGKFFMGLENESIPASVRANNLADLRANVLYPMAEASQRFEPAFQELGAKPSTLEAVNLGRSRTAGEVFEKLQALTNDPGFKWVLEGAADFAKKGGELDFNALSQLKGHAEVGKLPSQSADVVLGLKPGTLDAAAELSQKLSLQPELSAQYGKPGEVILRVQVPGRMNETVSYHAGENGGMAPDGQFNDRVDWMKTVGESAGKVDQDIEITQNIFKSQESKITEIQDKLTALDVLIKEVKPDVQAYEKHAGEPAKVEGTGAGADGARPETLSKLLKQKTELQQQLHESKLNFIAELMGTLRSNKITSGYFGEATEASGHQRGGAGQGGEGLVGGGEGPQEAWGRIREAIETEGAIDARGFKTIKESLRDLWKDVRTDVNAKTTDISRAFGDAFSRSSKVQDILSTTGGEGLISAEQFTQRIQKLTDLFKPEVEAYHKVITDNVALAQDALAKGYDQSTLEAKLTERSLKDTLPKEAVRALFEQMGLDANGHGPVYRAVVNELHADMAKIAEGDFKDPKAIEGFMNKALGYLAKKYSLDIGLESVNPEALRRMVQDGAVGKPKALDAVTRNGVIPVGDKSYMDALAKDNPQAYQHIQDGLANGTYRQEGGNLRDSMNRLITGDFDPFMIRSAEGGKLSQNHNDPLMGATSDRAKLALSELNDLLWESFGGKAGERGNWEVVRHDGLANFETPNDRVKARGVKVGENNPVIMGTPEGVLNLRSKGQLDTFSREHNQQVPEWLSENWKANPGIRELPAVVGSVSAFLDKAFGAQMTEAGPLSKVLVSAAMKDNDHHPDWQKYNEANPNNKFGPGAANATDPAFSDSPRTSVVDPTWGGMFKAETMFDNLSRPRNQAPRENISSRDILAQQLGESAGEKIPSPPNLLERLFDRLKNTLRGDEGNLLLGTDRSPVDMSQWANSADNLITNATRDRGEPVYDVLPTRVQEVLSRLDQRPSQLPGASREVLPIESAARANAAENILNGNGLTRAGVAYEGLMQAGELPQVKGTDALNKAGAEVVASAFESSTRQADWVKDGKRTYLTVHDGKGGSEVVLTLDGGFIGFRGRSGKLVDVWEVTKSDYKVGERMPNGEVAGHGPGTPMAAELGGRTREVSPLEVKMRGTAALPSQESPGLTEAGAAYYRLSRNPESGLPSITDPKEINVTGEKLVGQIFNAPERRASLIEHSSLGQLIEIKDPRTGHGMLYKPDGQFVDFASANGGTTGQSGHVTTGGLLATMSLTGIGSAVMGWLGLGKKQEAGDSEDNEKNAMRRLDPRVIDETGQKQGVGETIARDISVMLRDAFKQEAPEVTAAKDHIQQAYGVKVKDGEVEWNVRDLAILDTALKDLPQNFWGKDSLKEVRRDDVYVNSVGIKKTWTMGLYRPDDKTVTIYNTAFYSDYFDSPAKELEGVLVHEFTHSIQSYNPADGTTYVNAYKNPLVQDFISRTGGWQQNAITKEYSYTGKGLPTGYAHKSPLEDMSESAMLYHSDPAKLKAVSPDRYNFMRDRVFGGKEYGSGGKP